MINIYSSDTGISIYSTWCLASAYVFKQSFSHRGNTIQRLETTGSHCNDILQHGCTCNIESTVCYDHGSICSFSFALHHCPTQSGCGVDCQGGGHISQQSTHYSSGVGSVCEGGHKVKVFTLYSCNIIAVHTTPSGCGTCELDSIISRNEWLNNPLHSNSLVDSAGVSHHLSGTGLSRTHTGVQDNSSCMQDNIAMFLALRRNYIAARWENLPPMI